MAPVTPPTRWAALWDSRRTLRLLITRDLKVKYAGSTLGYVWSVLDPLMMAGVYWFVFTVLVPRSLGTQPYIVFLLCALLPWQWANACIRTSMRALSKDAKLVRSTSLPREIWILRTVGSRLMEFVFSLPVLVFFAIITRAHVTWHVVFFPVAMLIQTVLLFGLSMILAPVAVLYSDVERLVRIVMRLLFYFSPSSTASRTSATVWAPPRRSSTCSTRSPASSTSTAWRSSPTSGPGGWRSPCPSPVPSRRSPSGRWCSVGSRAPC